MEQTPRSGELMAKVAQVKEARTARLRDIMARSPEVTADDQATAALMTASFAGLSESQSVYSVEQDRSTYTVEPGVSLDIPRTASTEQLDSGPLRVPFTCTL